MFIELVESLRCVREHELTWLVASTGVMRGRDIVEGMLGCPICRAEYPIREGVADFAVGTESNADPGLRASAERAAPACDPAIALRAAALLGLTGPGGFVTLAGSWAASARAVRDLADQVQILAIDPPSASAPTSGEGVSIARVSTRLPLRPGVCRGIAADVGHATPELLNEAAVALRPQGRLIAPVSAPLPAGIRELARDEHDWVGITETVVQLSVTGIMSRARRSPPGTASPPPGVSP